MFRIGLCLYLVLVMLAGPAVCCCTSQRVMARLADEVGANKPQPTPVRTCCSHRAAGIERHRSRRDSKKPVLPNPLPCPCKEQGSQTTPLLSTDSQTIQQLLSKQFFQASPQVLTALPILDALAEQGNSGMLGDASALPFLAVQDILHVLHILRC